MTPAHRSSIYETAMALDTLFGGWKIVHTMGSRITRLNPMQGFCAKTMAP